MDWRRPYGRGWSFTAFMAALLAVGIGLLIGTATNGAVVGIIFALIWLALICRLALVGIYVSKHGLRYRGLFHTVTVPWSGVARVRIAPFRWVLPAASAQAIWIDRFGQAPLQTWVTDTGIDFIWRKKAFHQAFSAIDAEVHAHRSRTRDPDGER